MIPYAFRYQPGLDLAPILRRMEAQGEGFLAVIDADDLLMGTITDREIRRGILQGQSHIEDLINPWSYRISIEDLPQAQPETDGQLVPVVDQAGRLREVIRLARQASLPPQQPQSVYIMAGGLGRRLGELTRHIPKPMLPLGHKPVLHYIIDAFVEHGFRQITLCVNYKASVIREYFGDGHRFGAEIRYLEEQHPLGTAGPLSLIDQPPKGSFFVMNGDLLTTLNFESLLHFHEEKEAAGTMCIHEYNQQLPFGVVHTRNSRILGIEEKPYHKYFINAGIYVLEPQVLALLKPGEPLDMPALFERMVQADLPTHAYTINEFWQDIGHAEDYEAARRLFDWQSS
ncbi:MAG: alcohol dehydrogenase [Bacteroidetes bacterium]|nr:MAG: alcohol dehydrogenase [Bacteroidota bacterium]